MTRDKTLLDLELRLLVARHGKAQIARALSAIESVDLTLIDDDIKSYERKKTKEGAHRGPEKSIEEMVGQANPRPAARDLVEKLAHAYKKRDFLPEFRDVRRFLESRRISVSRFRSRADAFPTLLRVLAQCNPEELTALDERRTAAGSDLGIITDQILGSHD